MISDILCDTLDELDRYQSHPDHAPAYCDSELQSKIAALRENIAEILLDLNEVPTETTPTPTPTTAEGMSAAPAPLPLTDAAFLARRVSRASRTAQSILASVASIALSAEKIITHKETK